MEGEGSQTCHAPCSLGYVSEKKIKKIKEPESVTGLATLHAAAVLRLRRSRNYWLRRKSRRFHSAADRGLRPRWPNARMEAVRLTPDVPLAVLTVNASKIFATRPLR